MTTPAFFASAFTSVRLDLVRALEWVVVVRGREDLPGLALRQEDKPTHSNSAKHTHREMDNTDVKYGSD